MSCTHKTPIWLDCDPGHDDAFAILLAAHHPQFELLGISTVFGNASLAKTTPNASSILTALGKADIPIYPGHANPLHRAPMHDPACSIHGESGLDGTDLLPVGTAIVHDDADTILEMKNALMATKEGSAWLVATGSMTNAAALFERFPDVAGHIAGFSLMGGAVGGDFTEAILGEVDGMKRIGNWSPFAEFNILVDPEAAKSLFDNEVLKGKMVMVGLDLTHQVLVTEDVRKSLLYGPTGSGETVLRKMLVELMMFFAKTYTDVFGITDGPPLHDPLAVAIALLSTPSAIPFTTTDPENPTVQERFQVDVVTAGSYTEAQSGHAETGRTVVTKLPPGEPGVMIPRAVDLQAFWTTIEECIERADEANELAGWPWVKV